MAHLEVEHVLTDQDAKTNPGSVDLLKGGLELAGLVEAVPVRDGRNARVVPAEMRQGATVKSLVSREGRAGPARSATAERGRLAIRGQSGMTPHDTTIRVLTKTPCRVSWIALPGVS
jgi:hypothetical protein